MTSNRKWIGEKSWKVGCIKKYKVILPGVFGFNFLILVLTVTVKK
jgi:hypothetical protein